MPAGAFALVVLAFTALPLAELALLIALGLRVGVAPTLAVCALTGLVGATLARWQGLRTIVQARAAMEQGRFPADEILDGVLLLCGGAVLLTPGLITDAAGFALLLPPTRGVLKRFGRRWWLRSQGIVAGDADNV